MTICNMSIEAGARAGMIAPDETTFAYLKGRDHAPTRRAVGRGRGRLARAAHRRRRGVRRRGRHRRRRAHPVRHLGHQPRPGPAAGRAGARPGADRRRERAGRRREGADLHGPARPGTPLREIARGHRVRRLLHQRPHRGPARRRRRSSRAARWPTACGCWWCPGSMRVRFQAEEEGLDEVFTAAGAEWRSAGCSMCLGMNPDQLAPGERSASTSNRNFEGRQGKGGRTHLVSPLVAAATAVRGTLSCTGGPGLMERVPHPHRHRRPAAPLQRRHRPDHPGGLPQAGHPHRLRGRAVLGLAPATRLHPQRRAVLARLGAGGGARTSAPGRRASTPSGR